MRNESQRSGGSGGLVPRGRVNNGIIPNSFKAITGYWKYVSSGASTVASTVRSAASAVVERDGDANLDQITWAGFDKLELQRGIMRQALLLGFSCGFQVWDVEVADNVHNIVSRHDGPVSFLQILPKPLGSNESGDKFADSRPLLIICTDGSFSGDINVQEGSAIPCNGPIQQHNGSVNGSYMPNVVWFYSLRSQSYVHLLRFRSVVHLVRCNSRVVAVLQSTQIHCLNAATLEREYTVLTNPVPPESYGPANIGVGPLAVGPRWMAYSGSPVAISNSRRVSPQHLTSSTSFPSHASNGSLVAHYARESSKQLAAGIVTLGDMGYKKLSRYYSELLPEGGTARVKVQGTASGNSTGADNIGMIIVRDIVSKAMIAQFRAHKSPILSLCFDPSGMLIATASVLGHNINIFRIMPGLCGGSSGAASGPSYVHLYTLQRGVTNAVIQDISFSTDSQWIMISTSKGTNHLFAISPSGGPVNFQSTDSYPSERNGGPSLMAGPAVQSICSSGRAVTLSAVSRIRNGSNGWKNTVSGAAAIATGRFSALSGAIASVFHHCRGNIMLGEASSLKKNYYLLVFSPSGSVIEYGLHFSPASDGTTVSPGASADYDARITVDAIQKWNIWQKHNHKNHGDNIDMYGELGNSDISKVYPERMKCSNDVFSDVFGITKKENITTEEKLNLYISEAELQMHQNKNPLWARYEIYFQSMQTDDINDEVAYGGEIEMERVPVHILEARSKDLVPVFDYLQNPMFQQGRRINTERSDQFQRQGSGSISGFSHSTANDDILVNGLDEKGQDGLQIFSGTNSSGGSVNTNDTPIVNTEHEETVNTREPSVIHGQLRSVHNRDGFDLENRFTVGDEFD